MIGMFGVFLSTQIQTTVLGLQVYELARRTSSVSDAAWQVGLVGLAEAIPFLSLTLFGGWASDRWDRRILSIVGLLGLSSGALWLVLVNLEEPTSTLPFLAIQALAGAARALFRPAAAALGTELVPRELYTNAATWRTNLFQIATVSGPAVGTLLYAEVGAIWTYTVMTAGFMLGLSGLVVIRSTRRPTPNVAPILSSLREGIGFVFTNQILLGALSLDLFAVLFGGATALLPAFALDVLGAGPEAVGWLRSAPAVGALAMGLWLARKGPFRRTGITLFGCVAAFGVTWIAFALSPYLWLSLALLAAGGALDSVSMVLRATLVQVHTPPELMGRVLAVNSFFIGSSNELGAFESGVAARLLGLVPSVLVGGCLTVATVGITAALTPRLRKLDRLQG
ncbi:MAG: MFS transporter [Myxococcales bacterium]|nr:MFS transporter [Myxococcales bacterium]